MNQKENLVKKIGLRVGDTFQYIWGDFKTIDECTIDNEKDLEGVNSNIANGLCKVIKITSRKPKGVK